MAKLEAEVLLMGSWKNVSELEECLTLQELEALIKALRDQESRHNRFAAALKGIEIEEDDAADDMYERAKRRAEARLSGKSEDEVEFDALGLGLEII